MLEQKDYERISIVFKEDEFEIKLEAKKDFIDELEAIAQEDIEKAITFLDENKEQWVMLKEYHIKEQDLDRVINAQDEFKAHCSNKIATLKKLLR